MENYTVDGRDATTAELKAELAALDLAYRLARLNGYVHLADEARAQKFLILGELDRRHIVNVLQVAAYKNGGK